MPVLGGGLRGRHVASGSLTGPTLSAAVTLQSPAQSPPLRRCCEGVGAFRVRASRRGPLLPGRRESLLVSLGGRPVAATAGKPPHNLHHNTTSPARRASTRRIVACLRSVFGPPRHPILKAS